MAITEKERIITPSDVAKYFLLKTDSDGELISPLKMQKLVYYAYAHYMVKKKSKLFEEQIEAWAKGPVVPSLYKELKKFGSSPIELKEFTELSSENSVEEFINSFPKETREILDEVYNEYQSMTAFELVVLTHNEKPWSAARGDLAPNAHSSNPISDDIILEEYGR